MSISIREFCCRNIYSVLLQKHLFCFAIETFILFCCRNIYSVFILGLEQPFAEQDKIAYLQLNSTKSFLYIIIKIGQMIVYIHSPFAMLFFLSTTYRSKDVFSPCFRHLKMGCKHINKKTRSFIQGRSERGRNCLPQGIA